MKKVKIQFLTQCYVLMFFNPFSLQGLKIIFQYFDNLNKNITLDW